MANNFNLKKFLAEGTLLKEEQGNVSRNVKYFTDQTLLTDPNEGKSTMVKGPFTSDSILKAISPLINKVGYTDGGKQFNTSEFKGWLESNMGDYDMLQNDMVSARDLLNSLFGDYVFEVNELDGGENLADFLNMNKDEVYKIIVKPWIDYGVREGEISPDEFANLDKYLQDKWIDGNTSDASDDPNETAEYAIDFPNLYYYFELSTVPYPDDYEEYEDPSEIMILGKKLYLFSTDNP